MANDAEQLSFINEEVQRGFVDYMTEFAEKVFDGTASRDEVYGDLLLVMRIVRDEVLPKGSSEATEAQLKAFTVGAVMIQGALQLVLRGSPMFDTPELKDQLVASCRAVAQRIADRSAAAAEERQHG